MPDNTPTPPTNTRRTGLARVWHALLYSVDGLRAAVREEAAFRQELALFAILLLVVAVLPASLTQKAVLIASMFVVLIVELVNSAVEATVDRISLDRHELAKRAKDIGSAAVLLSLANCVVCWGLIGWEVYRAGRMGT